MATYAGIDYSTRKLAVAVVDASGQRTHLVSLHRHEAHRKEVGIDAIKSVLASFKDWATEGWLIDTPVVIESPIVGGNRNMQTGLAMATAAGALMASSYHYGSPSVDFVAPASWKKEVCGHGGYSKDEIITWLSSNHPRIFRNVSSHDDADAVCIALYSVRNDIGAPDA